MKKNHQNLSHECSFILDLSWQEWVIFLELVGYTLLAIASLILGSIFFGICSLDAWEPYWLIVHGGSHFPISDTRSTFAVI